MAVVFRANAAVTNSAGKFLMANASPEDAPGTPANGKKKMRGHLGQNSACRFDHLLGKTPQDCFRRIRRDTFTKSDRAKIIAALI